MPFKLDFVTIENSISPSFITNLVFFNAFLLASFISNNFSLTSDFSGPQRSLIAYKSGEFDGHLHF